MLMNKEQITEENWDELVESIETLRPKDEKNNDFLSDEVLHLYYLRSCVDAYPHSVFDPYRRIVEFIRLVNEMRLGEKPVDIEFLRRCLRDVNSCILIIGESAKDLFFVPFLFEYQPTDYVSMLIHFWNCIQRASKTLPHIQLYYLALASVWFYRQLMLINKNNV